jgi:molecular chaperone DnaJ
MMTVSDCTSCRGTGRIIEHPCHECRGRGRIDDERQLAVDIPEGVDTGTRLRLAGRGGAGEPGGPPGDLYVEIKVLRDPQLDRHGDDLHHRVNLGFAEATLGTEVEVPLVDGATERMTIPAGTQPGTVFRIAKRGMPRLRRRGRGDLLVTASVEVPASVTEDEEALLLQWAELRSENATEGKRRRRRRSR